MRFTQFAGFTLGKGTLADVTRALGDVPRVHTGDAGESTTSVCYRTKAGFVAFLAGELDGPRHSLGGYWLSQKATRPPCAAWPQKIKQPQLEVSGLRLGMTRDQFNQIVQVLVEGHDGWTYGYFESRRPILPTELDGLPPEQRDAIKRGEMQDYVDVGISISTRFLSRRLTELRVWKSETR